MSEFHLVINANSHDFNSLFDCLGSIMACDEQPNNISLIFNEYDPVYSPIFDIFEFRHYDIIKSKKYISYNRIRNNIVTSCDSSETKYIIFIEDDVIIKDIDFFNKIRLMHLNNTLVRFTEQMYGFSVDLGFLKNVKFDPGFIGQGFEDWDLSLLLADSVAITQPYLARHKNIDPKYNFAEFNREFFEKKWDISFDKKLSALNILSSDCFETL